MVVDLLTNNGEVVGATAVNTRTGEFIVIKAKGVILGVRTENRSQKDFGAQAFGMSFNIHFCLYSARQARHYRR